MSLKSISHRKPQPQAIGSQIAAVGKDDPLNWRLLKQELAGDHPPTSERVRRLVGRPDAQRQYRNYSLWTYNVSGRAHTVRIVRGVVTEIATP